MKTKHHFSDKEIDRLDRASDIYRGIGKSIRILDSVAWPNKVADDFIANKGKELPKPVYRKIKTDDVWEALDSAKSLVKGKSPVHDWLSRIHYSFGEATRLIESRGTKAFFTHCKNIYGTPSTLFRDNKTSAIDLARKLDGQFDLFCLETLAGPNYGKSFTAEQVKDFIEKRVVKHFGDDAPRVQLVDNISAKAAASVNRIRLRRDAPFSDLDGPQLLLHEAYVHIATTLNGRAHNRFKVLGTSHPLTTKTQEGLAVFSEIVNGAVDPHRMRRLTNRVLAIQQSIDGADFIDVYKFYLDRSENDREAYENTRRIFRGGVIEGGAPFTKDTVYLEGLVRVHNYLRVAIPTGNIHYPNYLFYGKIDLDDIDALKMLDEQKLLTFPCYRPPWMEDMRFMATVITYHSLLEKMDMKEIHEFYEAQLT